MIVRELLTRIGYEVDRKDEKKVKRSFEGIKRGASNLAGQLGLVFGAGAVVFGFKKVIDLASDVEETMNVVTTAFDDQADAVLQWAIDSGEAAGRSQFAMREYAATLGAVVGPTLGSAEATAELSTNMAQLAVDLGSFFNATDEDALEAIRAGLIGSQEPLLRFGVNMSVAALDAFALQEGLGKTTKQMTAAEKTMLRYRFILANTTKAQGDAAKTADGFANQSKRLLGNLQDLAVGIGKVFLPAAASALQGINAFAKAVKGPVIAAVRVLIAPFKLAAALIVGFVVGLSEASAVAKVALGGLAIALVGINLALKPLLLAQLLMIVKFAIIGGLILLLILVVEDLWLAITEGKGVIAGIVGEFWRLVDESGGVLTAIGGMFVTAIDSWLGYLFGFSNGTERIFFGIQAFIEGIINWITEAWIGMTQTMINAIRDVIDIGKGFFSGLGDLDKFFGLTDTGPISAPGSPAARAGGDVNARQEININVDAPGGNPAAIAAAVAPAAGRAAGDAHRRTAQQLLLGAPQ